MPWLLIIGIALTVIGFLLLFSAGSAEGAFLGIFGLILILGFVIKMDADKDARLIQAAAKQQGIAVSRIDLNREVLVALDEGSDCRLKATWVKEDDGQSFRIVLPNKSYERVVTPPAIAEICGN